MNMEDIFSQFGDIFGGGGFDSFFGGGSRGGRRTRKGTNLRVKLKLNLAEIANGVEKKIKVKKQKELFLNFTEEEKIIIGILNEKENVHIDEINIKSGINSSAVAAAILNLEFQSVIRSLPGKLYALYD